MSKAETFIPVFRHAEFDGPGAQNRSFTNFVDSLSDKSRFYPITVLGRSQIIEAMRQIPNYRQIDLILASRFNRTQQSAQIMSDQIRIETGRDVKIVTSPQLDTIWMPPGSLSEREFVELEQTGRKSAVADAMFQRWVSGQIGESPEMVQRRISTFLTYLKETMDRGLSTRPIVITHASFASAMLRYVEGLNLTTPRNEEQILKVAGYYFLVPVGDLKQKDFGVVLLKEKFLS